MRATALLIVSACVADPVVERTIAVERREDVVAIVIVAPPIVEGEIVLAGDRLAATISIDDDVVIAETIAASRSALPAHGVLSVAGDELHVTTSLEIDGVHWRASYRGHDYDLVAEPAALTTALEDTPLGRAMLELGAARRASAAWMAETDALFELAALAGEAPLLAAAHDAAPPGMIDGDRPGPGMTCSTQIQCASPAPICVTDDHSIEYGACTRTCVRDSDCAWERGSGRCRGAVIDVPAVSHAVMTCELRCADDNSCPGLLVCAGDGRCVVP
jgi:hypothetical protein